MTEIPIEQQWDEIVGCLSGIIDAVGDARKPMLFDAAVEAAKLVAAGKVTYEVAKGELFEFCSLNGLIEDEGRIAVERTILLGFAYHNGGLDVDFNYRDGGLTPKERPTPKPIRCVRCHQEIPHR